MESKEQTLADIETAYEKAFAKAKDAGTRLKAARGRYHIELLARREAGEKLTVADIKAYEAVAIDDVDYVRDAYLNYTKAHSELLTAKVAKDQAVRDYWDSKGR